MNLRTNAIEKEKITLAKFCLDICLILDNRGRFARGGGNFHKLFELVICPRINHGLKTGVE